MPRSFPLSFLLGLVLLAGTHFGALAADELRGKVTHVRDGDTIEVENVPIRLNGLHAPELGSPGGERAARFMRDLVEGRPVVCRLNGEKSYDRLIGVCWLGQRDIAAELVAAGLGRDCPRYSGGRYARYERSSARGMKLPDYCVRKR